MDDSNIATMPGEHNNEICKTGAATIDNRQLSTEESTAEFERGSKVAECIPELVCIKQEPHDVDVEEESENIEEPVATSQMKKRWHEFGIEFSQESTVETSCSSSPTTLNQDSQKQMEFCNEGVVYEESTQKGWQGVPARNNQKQVQENLRGQNPDIIAAFSEEQLQSLCYSVSLKNDSEYFDQLNLKEIKDSAFKTLLLEREELLKNRERLRKAMARENETPQQRRKRLDNMCLYINHKRAAEKCEEREERLLKLRLREAERRANETPEQRQYRLNQGRVYARKRRANQTPEEREQRLLQGRLYEAQRRANETPEQREQRLTRMRLSEAKRRANESPEERERRLVRTRIAEAQRRANETSEEREQRLIRMRLSEAQRRSNETEDIRMNRLAKARLAEAQRRANETPEDRERRLIRMRLSEAHRRANETPEERRQRLLRTRLYEAQRRSNETSEEREDRLNRMRLSEAKRRENETPEERDRRLSRMRSNVLQHRIRRISDKGEQELNTMNFDVVQECSGESTEIHGHHLSSLHFDEHEVQTDLTREQVQNFNMYFNIAKQTENKTVEPCERFSPEQYSTCKIPKEKEKFLLNVHLSKIQKEKT